MTLEKLAERILMKNIELKKLKDEIDYMKDLARGQGMVRGQVIELAIGKISITIILKKDISLPILKNLLQNEKMDEKDFQLFFKQTVTLTKAGETMLKSNHPVLKQCISIREEERFNITPNKIKNIMPFEKRDLEAI